MHFYSIKFSPNKFSSTNSKYKTFIPSGSAQKVTLKNAAFITQVPKLFEIWMFG